MLEENQQQDQAKLRTKDGKEKTKSKNILLENLTDEANRYCLVLCDEMFDHFPLFD